MQENYLIKVLELCSRVFIKYFLCRDSDWKFSEFYCLYLVSKFLFLNLKLHTIIFLQTIKQHNINR